MKTYRVWIEVEEYDTRTNEHETLGCGGCLREMRKSEDAEALAAALEDIASQSLEFVDRDAPRIVQRLANSLGHWLPLKPFKRKRKEGDS